MQHPFSLAFRFLLPAVALSVCAGALHAQTIASFTDGNGSTSYDQYTGTAGGGWSGGWTSAGSVSASVSSATPVNGGGNYVTVTETDLTTNGTFATIDRQLAQPGNIALGTTYNMSLDIRMDSAVTSATNVVFANNYDGQVLGGSNGFEIRALSSNGTVQWTFRNGNARVDTNIALVQGHTYSFELALNPAASNSTYDARITDLTTLASFQQSNLNYRYTGDATTTERVMDWIQIGVRDTTVNATPTISADNIVYSQVPEPTAFAFLGAATLAVVFRRRGRR